MKKRVLFVFLVMALVLCSCGKSNSTDENDAAWRSVEKAAIKTPDTMQIRAVCNLATLECVYHNVARSEKKKGSGLNNLLKADRKYWVEYSGTVKLGVDMAKGDIKVEDGTIIVYMPDAEILSIEEDPSSEKEPITDKDKSFIMKNPIQSDDITETIKSSQESVKEQIMNNTSLLRDAKERAKKLIENYIRQIEDAIGAEYKIEWRDI